MTFFSAANCMAVTNGNWLVEPTGPLELTGVGTDTRANLEAKAFLALRGDNHDGHDYLRSACAAGAQLLIVEQCAADRIPKGPAVLLVADTRQALGALASAYRATLTDTTVIAVTGSCGKTTTKEMIHAALHVRLVGIRAPKSFNNDIGVPLTILDASPEDDYLVLEIGMNKPGEIAALGAIARPDIVVITTIGPAHLSGLGSVQAIATEKASLLGALAPGGVAVLNTDHEFANEHASSYPNGHLFGAAEHAHTRMTDYGNDDAQQLWWFDVNNTTRFQLPIPGRHNAANALAAIAVARHLNIPDESIAAGLLQVELPAMRMHRSNCGGVIVFNDAYNANPQSMRASIEAFLETSVNADRRIVVLGDMLELGADAAKLHEELGRELLEISEAHSIDQVVLVGELTRYTGLVLSQQWGTGRVQYYGDLDQQVIDRIWKNWKPGDAVLLKASRGIALERVVNQRPQPVTRSQSVAVA